MTWKRWWTMMGLGMLIVLGMSVYNILFFGSILVP